MTDDNRDKFIYIAGRYGQIIKFYNVEKICAEEIARIRELFKNYPTFDRFSIGAICRLLSPKILSDDIEKIVYLDSDIIVNLDINELWQIPVEYKPLAACPETEQIHVKNFFPLCQDGIVKEENYLNSGVLDELNNLEKGIKFISENPRYRYPDQDILNYCFSQNYFKLPVKFNYSVWYSRWRGDYNIKNRICHYFGRGLNTYVPDNFNNLWFSCFEKTPWFTKKAIAHLDEEYRKLNAELKNFAVQISALISGKSRAFFTAAQNIEVLKKIFLVRDDEQIISLVNQESFQTLIKSMAESRGKKVFFILFEQYNKLRDDLKKIGFVENQDFMDATKFLSDANGVPLNTYNLTRNM